MPVLAIDGGPKAVTAPMEDSWQNVSGLEKPYVNQVLENVSDAYSQLDAFEEEFSSRVGTRHAISMCNGTATLHSAIFAAGARVGGVATTNDDALYDRMMALGQYRRCGSRWKTDRFQGLRGMGLGVKYRANPMGIAMARARLERLPGLNEERAAWFNRLDGLLGPVPGVFPQKTYPEAVRGGMLLYTGVVDPNVIGAPVATIGDALQSHIHRVTPRSVPSSDRF